MASGALQAGDGRQGVRAGLPAWVEARQGRDTGTGARCVARHPGRVSGNAILILAGQLLSLILGLYTAKGNLMKGELPPFEPVTHNELRAMWSKHRDKDIRRLTLEVERYRRLLAEMDDCYTVIHQSWRDTVGGDLFALNRLKQLVLVERFRLY